MPRQGTIKRVLVDLNHPADFHFFKHLIAWMRSQDYVVKIVARDKECLQMLLDDAEMGYISRGRGSNTLVGKYLYAIWILTLLVSVMIRIRPTLALSLSSPYLALLARIFGITCVTYDDTDDNPRLLPLIKKSTYLFSPSSYPHKFHQGHFQIPVFKELAYLHPAQFKLALKKSELFFRITRTDSVHHSAESRLDLQQVLDHVGKLNKDHPVILSAETELNVVEVEGIRRADPIHIHNELASCRAFWGNSATMAAEAAVMGIPAIFVSAEKFAYITELERYGLLFYFHPDELIASFTKLERILTGDPPAVQFQKMRHLLLSEKVDMTSFMIWFIDNLPQSAQQLKTEPEFIKEFLAKPTV